MCIRGQLEPGLTLPPSSLCHTLCSVPILLAEVLGLEVLRSAGARVVSAESELHREVRWVHNSEIADIASFLRGGEVLLTAGLGIGSTPESQRRYIESLDAVHGAALFLELGRRFKGAPTALLHEAERRRFPVITLAHEIRFMDVTENVNRTIISRQYEELQRAERVGRELNELLLSRASLVQLLAKLAEIVHNPVVLEDPAHQLVAHARFTSDFSTLLANWETHSRRGHGTTDKVSGGIDVGSGVEACLWAPILLRGEIWGRLHVVGLDTALDKGNLLVMDRAAAAIGIALLGERDVAHVAERARGGLIAEALEGSVDTREELVARARGLGVNLAERRIVATAIEVRRSSRPNETSPQAARRLRTLYEEVCLAARDRGLPTVLALDGSRVVGVLGLDLRVIAPQALEELAAAVTHRRTPGALGVVFGCALAQSSVGRALEQAIEALRFGQLVGIDGVHHFEDLGFHHLLARLSEGPELARYVEAELGPLLAHDAGGGARLLPTLQTYLDHGGSKSATASALHIQRRSLYHRLERVERLLGKDLDAIEHRMRLYLAVRSLELLRGRSLS